MYRNTQVEGRDIEKNAKLRHIMKNFLGEASDTGKSVTG